MDIPTEELCTKLDELGVAWWQRKCHTCWKVEKKQGTEHWRAWLAPDGTITLKVDAIYGFTPEQAISATVGRVNLTAEQVREAIMSADRWRKPMGDTGMTNTHLIIRDDGWQAIADELNATVGVGTCHSTSKWTNVFKCSVCGFEYDFVTDPYQGPKFCPRCGRKVVVK